MEQGKILQDEGNINLLDVYKRYYFKTKGQEPDVYCVERCMFWDNGICIGSAACQKCEHRLGNNIDEWDDIIWIKCRKINEATGRLPSNKPLIQD